ncbi:MAG: decaprenyl-phosphate phosphoribosyltransferase [Sedimentisphaerales bacterium]|nr:decaprenyl-phosphate phosphoribosyltransferase [Sedimentisphaerales bacterium]
MRFLRIMRPSHWTKNVFVFAALVFGQRLSGTAEEVLVAVASAIGGFACFCLASSAIYIFNDIIDREADRSHPEKSRRPIASGAVGVGSAAALAIICAAGGIAGAFVLDGGFGRVIVGYILLMVLYSLFLKRAMILDCVIISIGFCLRAVGGAMVVKVGISPWLVICTFALCLFVAFGKRRSEIAQLGENSEQFRKTLGGYTPELLAHMLDVTSGLAIVCFLLYATDERTAAIVTDKLIYTTPVVLYCVFRFSALVQKGKYAGPVELTLHDVPFQIGVVLWVLLCIAIVYAEKLGIDWGSVLAH